MTIRERISFRQEQLSKFKAFLGARVWNLFLLTVVLGCVWFVVEFSFIYVLQGFFSAIGLISSQQLFLPSWYPQGLAAAVTGLVLFGVVRSFISVGKTALTNIVSQIFIQQQRERILKLALLGDRAVSTPETIAQFSERTNQAANCIQSISNLLLVTMTMTFLTIGGFWLLPTEFLSGIAIFALLIFPLNFLNKTIIRSAKGVHQEWKNVTETLIFGIRNSFLLKIYNRREIEVSKGSEYLRNYLHHFIAYYRVIVLKGALPNVIGVTGIALVTIFSVSQLHTPAMKLVSLYYIFIRLAQNVSEASTYFSDLKMYVPSFRSLYQFQLHGGPLSQSRGIPVTSKTSAPARTTLSLRNVTFSYPEGKPVFQNFSIEVSTGQVLLMKGESGSGKSTLLSLLTGVLQPTTGTASFNGKDLGTHAPELSEIMGYVGPESFLLPGTVRANLLYPNSDRQVPDQDFWSALEAASIDDIVRRLPAGLDEFLTEDAQLSTGQKQRLGFARALLRKPRVLILDEATSNLDIETEAKIMKMLMGIRADLLLIIVSHRDTFDQFADQTLRLSPSLGVESASV